MTSILVSAELWNEIEPLLPEQPLHPLGGRPFASECKCLTGIVFVLRTGMPWRFILRELGCGSG